MTLVYLLIGLLPSFLQRPIRNLMGGRVEAGARIAPFTWVAVRDLRMERGARIGPFVVLRAETAVLGRNAHVRPVSMFKVRHLEAGRDARIDPFVLVNCDYGPRSRLVLGKAVRVFSFSVLEPSEGIHVGDQTGLGGHTLIFCHGSWPNYLEGAPYARGPVRIGEEVWIPWRVMILPNVEIGSGAVIGAHSLVRSSVPARALYSGVPARQVVENVWTPLEDGAEKERRLAEVVESFHAFHEERLRGRVEIRSLTQGAAAAGTPEETVLWSFSEISGSELQQARKEGRRATVIDLANLRAFPGGPLGRDFVGHLATFGVRLSPTDPEEL
jgi:acetyltransferase-like isoleucine patch superfamily enzyme